MEKKISAILTIITFTLIIGTWLLRVFLKYPVMPLDKICMQAILIVFIYFFFGVFIAKVGISLITEAIEEKRNIEEEKRHKASQRYKMLHEDDEESFVDGDTPESLEESGSVDV